MIYCLKYAKHLTFLPLCSIKESYNNFRYIGKIFEI